MEPTVGRVVAYTLSEQDASTINTKERAGNRVTAGEVYPAMIVRVIGVPSGTTATSTAVNLQVLLDGDDTYWATSRSLGDDPGMWSWPKRVGEDDKPKPPKPPKPDKPGRPRRW